jgi:hypothetical protein
VEKIAVFLRADFVIYCFSCVVGAGILVPSLKLGLGAKGELGPGLLPFAAGLCVLVTGAILAVLTLIKREKAAPSEEVEVIDRKGWIGVGELLLAFAVWPLLAGMIGYILSTFLVSLGIAKAVGYQGWRGPLILSISITFCIWLIFGFLFQLDLPAGFSF